ncbi:DUF6171 family protein [Clostridium cellulovorans]|uniref:Uncharacterized protein n=2 Tax=Clostridium cellulovorans TaxID=1493 RepID=D9SM33_CLOC7|nr:DUF6171 family protein [Clostridium cellulovorans]AAN05451.1 hypothetical protein Orf1x [Clostridium cellulovorans]ADL51764.1 hypothetical protein Clocel_2021 [Clostridium cellulovorans 743B]
MEKKENCKGCRANVNVDINSIEALVEEIRNNSEFDVVSSEVYDNRLNICKECKDFVYGTTCNQCGCFVKVRALLKSSVCPSYKGDLWGH